MANKANNQTVSDQLNGPFIYHTDKYRNVYWDVFTKKAYNISASDLRRFRLFQMGPVVALMVGFVTYYYLHLDPLLALLIGVVFYGVFMLIFRFSVVKNLAEIRKFEKPVSPSMISSIVNTMEPIRIAIMAVLALAMLVLCVINIRTAGYSGTTLILNYALAVLAAGFTVMYTLALIRKLKK